MGDITGPCYLPWEPLDRWLHLNVRASVGGTMAGSAYNHQDPSTCFPTGIEIADAVGMHPARIYFFRKEGRVSVSTADKICSTMGVHMATVYGQIYWDYLDERIAFDEARYQQKMAQRREYNARMVANRSAQRAGKREQQCA